MADFSTTTPVPGLTTPYTSVLSIINDKFTDLVKGLDTTPTNLPANAIAWSASSNKWRKWSGTAWQDLSSLYAINISGNAATATNSITATSASKISNTNGWAVEPDSTLLNFKYNNIFVGSLNSGGGLQLSEGTGKFTVSTYSGIGYAGAEVLINYSDIVTGYYGSNNYGTYLGSRTAAPFDIETNSIFRFRIDENGHAGLGMYPQTDNSGYFSSLDVLQKGDDWGITLHATVDNPFGSYFQFYRTKGPTPYSTGALLSGDWIGTLQFDGSKGTSADGYGAWIAARASENWSATSAPTEIVIATCPVGGTDPIKRHIIGSDGIFQRGLPGDTTGTLYPDFACRAWVNFNGTGTVARRAWGNVSGITDNGTGDYTVNFTTAMPDANYAAIASASTTAGNMVCATLYTASTPTTTAVRFTFRNVANGSVDPEYASVAVFR